MWEVFPKKIISLFAETSFTDYLAFLKQTGYQEALLPLLQENTIDFAALALVKDDLVTQQFVAAEALGPMPLLAFLNAKTLEIQNFAADFGRKAQWLATEEELRG